MRTIILLPIVVLAFCAEARPESVDGLIKKLSSPRLEERAAAGNALLELPEAETALRKAVANGDLETRGRIEIILRKIEQKDLRSAIDAGRMDRVIQRLASWPEGKDELELWSAVRRLVKRIDGLT